MPPGGLPFLFRQEREEIVVVLCKKVSCCGARQKHRLTKQACFLPTAATRSARFICHWQRSHRSPPPPIRWYGGKFEPPNPKHYDAPPVFGEQRTALLFPCLWDQHAILLPKTDSSRKPMLHYRESGRGTGAALIAGAINSAPGKPTSLVTFLFGDKKVTRPVSSLHYQFTEVYIKK